MAANAKTESQARMDEYLLRMEIAKAPAWMPNKGDVLVGEVIGLQMRGTTEEMGGYGLYPCITYRQLDPSATPQIVNLHAFHGMIRERLAELKTDLGSRQIVTYLGPRKKTTANPKGEFEEYHDYYAEDFDTVGTAAAKAEDFTF
jgi:hypothetical protein